MQETKRMADAANRMGQEAQERVQSGFDAANSSVRTRIMIRIVPRDMAFPRFVDGQLYGWITRSHNRKLSD